MNEQTKYHLIFKPMIARRMMNTNLYVWVAEYGGVSGQGATIREALNDFDKKFE